jgi:hypothetical protein
VAGPRLLSCTSRREIQFASVREIRILAYQNPFVFRSYHLGLGLLFFFFPVYAAFRAPVDRDHELVEDLIILFGLEVEGPWADAHFEIVASAWAGLLAGLWTYAMRPNWRTLSVWSWSKGVRLIKRLRP